MHKPHVELESLEGRMLLSATLSVTTVLVQGGLQLQIQGTDAADRIFLTQSGSDITVSAGEQTLVETGPFKSVRIDGGAGNDWIKLDASVTVDAVLHGDAGADTLVGGSGDDRLYGDGRRNVLRGGSGNDVLVSVGGAPRDRLRGGDGQDSFWLDDSAGETLLDPAAAELAAGAVHRVSAFTTAGHGVTLSTSVVPAAEVGQTNLPEPAVTNARYTYKSFADRPLFSDAGPSPDDVKQGALTDCYFLAVLSAMAKANPDSIRQSIVDLGDGTYAVQFARQGHSVYVRVDADLPTLFGNDPAYAALGAQNSLWVAPMEKAYAVFRTGQASYNSLAGGWMTEAYQALGRTPTEVVDASNAQSLLQEVQADLASGQAVTWGVADVPVGVPLVADHGYSVDAVLTDDQGQPVALRLRNPWAVDGAGHDGADDGYVTLTPEQAFTTFWGLVSAAV